MRDRSSFTGCVTAVAALLLLAASSAPAAMKVPQTTMAGNVTPYYLYELSNFAGPIPFPWAKVFTEDSESETYVMTGSSVSIFNASGMEIYQFGFDSELGVIQDAAMDGAGNLVLLSYEGFDYRITRADFRGVPIHRIALKNLPPALSGFAPNRILWAGGRFYLPSFKEMVVVVTDAEGAFLDTYDLAEIIGLDKEERENTGIYNFQVDREGNLLFALPATAGAYVVSPDRRFRKIGRRGSGPGRFGIPMDIVRDGKGHFFVLDTLKCAVLVFDKDMRFLTEFGYRGRGPGRLIAPRGMAIDGRNRLYVSQSTNRGVTVYQITYE